ncbi:MAG: glycosyltransferase family 10 domain-containing protein, partial [Phycisphaerales bacterium]
MVSAGEAAAPRLRVAVSDVSAGADPMRMPWMHALRRRFDVEVVPIEASADVLFFSDFGTGHFRHQGLKVWFSCENMLPDPHQSDFALTSLHRPGDPRHFRIPEFLYAIDSPDALVRPSGFDAAAEARAKRHFCSFGVSNPRGRERNALFRALDARRGVRSGGRHYNNVGGPVRDKRAFVAECRFAICFENTEASGYTTEKLTDAFLARTVPIYWGNPDVAHDFDPRSMVLAYDFPSPEALADKVLALDRDESAYAACLAASPLRGNAVGPDLRLDGLDAVLHGWLTSGTVPGRRHCPAAATRPGRRHTPTRRDRGQAPCRRAPPAR